MSRATPFLLVAGILLLACDVHAGQCVPGEVVDLAVRDADADGIDEVLVLKKNPSEIVVVRADDCRPTGSYRFSGTAISLSVHGDHPQIYVLVLTRDPDNLHALVLRSDGSLHSANTFALPATPAQVTVRRSSDPAMKDAIFVRYAEASYLTRFESCKRCACSETKLPQPEPVAGLVAGDFDADGRSDLAIVGREGLRFLSDSPIADRRDVIITKAAVLAAPDGDRLVATTNRSLLIFNAVGEQLEASEFVLSPELRLVGTCESIGLSTLILANNTHLYVVELAEDPRVLNSYQVASAQKAACVLRRRQAAVVAATSQGAVLVEPDGRRDEHSALAP